MRASSAIKASRVKQIFQHLSFMSNKSNFTALQRLHTAFEHVQCGAYATHKRIPTRYVCSTVCPLCGAASSVFKCTRPVVLIACNNVTPVLQAIWEGGERSGNFGGKEEKVQVLAKTSLLTTVFKALFVDHFILLILFKSRISHVITKAFIYLMSGHINIGKRLLRYPFQYIQIVDMENKVC